MKLSRIISQPLTLPHPLSCMSEHPNLKQLDDENTWLKKIVADPTLDQEMSQDVIRRKL